MTSYRLENLHIAELNQLLLDSGLTCERSTLESEETSVESEETEKKVQVTEAESDATDIVAEEETEYVAEEIEEEAPKIFPTASLRRVLPDKIRSIEKQNRIHVLPDEFNRDLDPLKIPKIDNTPPQVYINELAELTGSKGYKSSLAEYWFLDTLANLLRRAQKDRLEKVTQALLIRWFCEWMKEMQHFDAADRRRMLQRFKDNMIAAAGYVAREGRLPTPSEIGVSHLTEGDMEVSRSPKVPTDPKHLVSFEGTNFQCTLYDLTKIIHYIYDLFSTDFQYDLMRSVFTFTPEYQLIDVPHQIRHPKRIYAPLKARAKERPVKKEPKVAVVKGKRKEAETEQYLHLLRVQSELEREIEEEADRDREDWNRRSHLLPLAFAVSEEFIERYWPPPPVEGVPEPEPDTKGKGMNKKK